MTDLAFAQDLAAVLNALDREGRPVAHVFIPSDEWEPTDIPPAEPRSKMGRGGEDHRGRDASPPGVVSATTGG